MATSRLEQMSSTTAADSPTQASGPRSTWSTNYTPDHPMASCAGTTAPGNVPLFFPTPGPPWSSATTTPIPNASPTANWPTGPVTWSAVVATVLPSAGRFSLRTGLISSYTVRNSRDCMEEGLSYRLCTQKAFCLMRRGRGWET